MLEPPQGPWTEDFPSKALALKQAPFAADWKKRAGLVRHGFTHFELEIEVYAARDRQATENRQGNGYRPNNCARWRCPP